VKLHLALVSAYPTETEARAAIADDLHVVGCPYLGIWTMPLPYDSRVHVFSDAADVGRLERDGWTKEDA
jgi:hypothetical protein